MLRCISVTEPLLGKRIDLRYGGCDNSPGGQACPIVASIIAEVDAFAKEGFRDILYAVGIEP